MIAPFSPRLWKLPRRRAALMGALASGLVLGACASPHNEPAVAHSSTPLITDEAMLAPEDVNTQAGSSTIPATEPLPETAANMGPDATTPAQPIGVTTDEPTAAMPGTPDNPQIAPQALSDSRFTQKAVSSSATEIALARIALLRAQSEEVRNFARHLLVDHRNLAIALDDFGLQRGFMVNWRMSQVGESVITRLRVVPAGQFDGAYIGEMVRAHESAVAMLEAQASGTGETASLAREKLPMIRDHLRMARDLQGQV